MSYKKALVRLLDRPGGRALLSRIATRVVRGSTGDDIELLFLDGLWTRRAGTDFFPDSPQFSYVYEDFSTWKTQMERYLSDASDYWLQYYRPDDGDVVVDVGAGRGEDTVAFSRLVGKTGRVIAIEADPLSFDILRSFCRANSLSNVTTLHVALMDSPGLVRVKESAVSWRVTAVGRDGGATGAEVQCRTFDEVYRKLGLGRIDFLKMNIEGAERYALPGMRSVIPHVEQICVACHDFWCEQGHGQEFRTRAFVEQFLTENGFELASRPSDPRDYVRDHVFGLRQGRVE